MLSTTICSLDIILHIGVKDQDPNWLILVYHNCHYLVNCITAIVLNCLCNSIGLALMLTLKDQDPNWLIRIPQLPLSGELYHCHCSELSL
jgi:hypothetical protein